MSARYEHTQKGPLWLVLAALCVLLAGGAAATDDSPWQWLLIAVALLFLGLGAMFARLTVSERDDHLDVRFGPLRLFGTRVRYGDVRGLRRARSSFVDGWGVHWVPGRGWTFNLWGFDCVEVTTERGIVRIGTDDPDGLLAHLAVRTGVAPAGGGGAARR